MAADDSRDQKRFNELKREFEEHGDALRRITEKIEGLQAELEALNRREARRHAK